MSETTLLLWLFLSIIAGSALLYGLHRLGLWLEDEGYIYYRKKSGGGAYVNAALELDKFVRPSVEHRVEAADHLVIEDEQDGD